MVSEIGIELGGQGHAMTRVRRAVATGASVLALCLAAQGAWAQDADAERGGPIKASPEAADTVNTAGGKEQPEAAQLVTADASADLGTAPGGGDITVTGSRIVRDGYSAPTPVSVLSSADIQAQAPANLAEFVNTLPAIAGSTTPATGTAALSAGTAGISSLNLRSLGANRTLVLVDGQRSVASSATGLVDINTIPQDLVERVEVVTGGASAQYGSDAVGGVVNFILNKNFKGVRLTGTYGETTYNDGSNYRFTGSAGIHLLDDRLHILLNAEYYHLNGIDYNTRKWNQVGYAQINNPDYRPGNGQPERLVTFQAAPQNLTPGGVILSSSNAALSAQLRGTYFGSISPTTGRATTGQLAYGRSRGPTDFYMVGGDWRYTLQNYEGNNSLLPGEKRTSAFGRVAFELTDDVELFGQVSYNRYQGESFYIPLVTTTTYQWDNAFLPANIAALLAPTRASISVGSTNQGYPTGGAINDREVFRYVVGANGRFGAFDRDWKWDFYFQRGISKPHEELFGTHQNARFNAASDAIVATSALIAAAGNPAGISAGQIVCRNTLSTNAATRAQFAGCVPLNRIGINAPSQEAIDYVIFANPTREQRITQSVAALSFSGSLFDLPAGAVSVAFGGEYRKEKIDGKVDPIFNTGWLYGNYLVNRGGYNVKEAFLELAAPLFTGFEVNAAGRVTDYSTSGTVQTYKLGATYEPLDGVRLRGTYSRDIRAPNLDELFASGTGRTNTVVVLNQSINYVLFQTGNQTLNPEKATSYSFGTVLTPRFMPGFSVAVDYYKIKIDDAIGAFLPQDVADLCYEQKIAEQCANIASTGVAGQPGFAISNIFVKPFNFLSSTAKGLDIEASYRAPLDTLLAGAPGSVTLRTLFTHYIKNLVSTGVGFPRQTAGENVGSGPPSWIYRASLLYNVEPFTFSLIGRGLSGGKIDNSFIECASSCPASTVEHRTINTNRIKGAFYIDTSITYGFKAMGAAAELQFAVNNLLNRDPSYGPPVSNNNSTPANPATNRMYYDFIGRTFRVVAKVKF